MHRSDLDLYAFGGRVDIGDDGGGRVFRGAPAPGRIIEKFCVAFFQCLSLGNAVGEREVRGGGRFGVRGSARGLETERAARPGLLLTTHGGGVQALP